MGGAGTLRRWSLAVALAVTVAAAGWVGGDQEGGGVAAPVPGAEARPQRAEPPERRPDSAISEADSAMPDVEKLLQRSVSREFGEMFPARSWEPPSPPPSARKPEPPRAPPLPFTFLGRIVEDGTTAVFLARQGDTYVVRAGDTIDNAYRIDEINGAAVELTYLPLQQRQTLQIGAIN